MKVTNTKGFRFLVCPAVFLVSVLWLLLTARLLGLITLAGVAILYFHFLRSGRSAWLRLAWVVFIISTLIPADLSFRDDPGPPRFVRLVMGTPTKLGSERAHRGEIILGGCVVNGYEPEWVWVW